MESVYLAIVKRITVLLVTKLMEPLPVLLVKLATISIQINANYVLII